MNLVVKPKKNSQEIVSVTPESAGWRYISFSAHQLAPGETLTFSDPANELCVVVLTGIVSAEADGLRLEGDRRTHERLRRCLALRGLSAATREAHA